MRNGFIAAVLVTLLGIAAAGCQDDEDERPLTREEFISASDAICAETQRRVYELQKALPDVFPASFPDSAFADYYERVAKLGDDAVGSIQRLDGPPQDAKAIDEALGNLKAHVQAMRELGSAAADGDHDAYVRLARGPVDREAVIAYGFTDCAGLGLGPAAGR